MSKKIFFMITVASAILLLAISSGCGRTETERDHLLIVTTIYPYEILLRELAVDNTEIISIIPANSSPHTYSPKPEDIKKLEDSDLIISNGAELEAYLHSLLSGMEDKHIEVFNLISDVLYVGGEEMLQVDNHQHDETHSKPAHHHDDGRHHHHINPHFWLDPVLVRHIAEGISEALIMLDPQNENLYRDKLTKLDDKLTALHNEIIADRENLKKASVLHFHDAFHYFNKRYGIHSAGLIVHSPGKEPTAADLVNIGKQIKEYDVKAIFIEPQLNPKSAEVIAKEFGLNIDTLDPIGNKDVASTISELIVFNWNVIKKQLGS